MAPHNDKTPSRLLVTATVTFYLVAAICMILANKWVLNTTTIPFFFLFVQLFFSVALLALTHTLGLLKMQLTLNANTCKALAPMVAINVLGLNFNNLTLKYVDASFYQVARGLLLPITVGFSSVLLHARPSFRILISCAIVTAGFFVGVLIDSPATAYWGKGSASTKAPSLLGVTFGILSSVTTALHAVVIKRSLDAVDGSAIQLAWYSNVLSSVIMMPIFILAGELPGVMALLFGPTHTDELSTFLWGSTITGVVGFLICIAGFLSIKITSPITHMVSSAVRGVVQTVLSVAFFHDVITTGRASSIAIILVGSIYYTWVKNQEAMAQRRDSDASTSQVHAKLLPRSRTLRDEDERVNNLENGDIGEQLRSAGNGQGHQYQLHVRQPSSNTGQLTPELGKSARLE